MTDQARARSLAGFSGFSGFSEDAGEGKDDGDSVSRRSYADDEHDERVDDEHDCEEELLELTEQDLLRMLDAQEPSLQACVLPKACGRTLASIVCCGFSQDIVAPA
jgi:hypothetical protein